MNQLRKQRKLKKSKKKMELERRKIHEQNPSRSPNQNPSLKIQIPKNLLSSSPMSMKLKSLRKSMSNLATNLMLEPTLKQDKLWASKSQQRQWRQNQTPNQ